MKRYVFYHRLDDNGEIAESDLIVAPATEWNRSPEQLDQSWCVVRDGRHVLALRLSLDLTTIAATVEPASTTATAGTTPASIAPWTLQDASEGLG
jgi:hypothetical protein